jgi:REP element-mobilizing transposase RayT
MDKFQNKYRIPSARLQQWDYRWAGSYFITICTQDRIHYFGTIENQQVQLSHVGIIADLLWHQIPHHAQNIELGPYVIMPNHVHGILIITTNEGNGNANRRVETLQATSKKPPHVKNEQMANISPKSGSVSAIIRSYKSAVTRHAHRLGFVFDWQTRFHDHIIRNEESFQKISNYIVNNPANWQEDTFFAE